MKYRLFILSLLASSSLFAAEEKPNIVMFFIDDWAWNGTPIRMDDSMPNSKMPAVAMPNLEKLARDGMKFRNVPRELASEFKNVKLKRGDFSDTMQHKFDECLKIGGDLDDSMHQYLGDVYSIDQNIGRLLATIDELGIRENTIFVFSSDHGPAPVILTNKGARKYSNNMLGYAGIYRGGKHTQYEGGTRVPFIIRWPGHVKACRVDSESVTSFIDWMPTLASIAGIDDLPAKLDGEDISDIWLDRTRERTKPLLWRTSSSGSQAVIREAKWKLHQADRKREAELYDLSDDPSESRNLAEQHPDVVDKLNAKLDAWKSELPKKYEK